MSSLSISIVLYKTDLRILTACLSHYYKAFSKLPCEVTVELLLVNNSHHIDGDVIKRHLLADQNAPYPITYIAAPKNGGYGYGHNLAIMHSQATYHIVSNADIYIDEQALNNAYAYLETHPDVGLLSPDVYDMDNHRCYLCKQEPSFLIAALRRLPHCLKNRWADRRLARFENQHLDYDHVISDYSFPTGCWMFFRMETLKALHGFDEGYFLYCEDADIGRRLKAIATMVYVPTVKCHHEWQRASAHSIPLLLTHIRSTWRYTRKFRKKT